MFTALPLILSIVVELIKLFRGISGGSREYAAQAVLMRIDEINRALTKTKETGGDTSDLERLSGG